MELNGLDPEKKRRIIAASIEEFARGYDQASTNRIVRKAGISKGLLFHYFGCKHNLFLHVLREYLQEYQQKFFADLTELPSDMFERFKVLAMQKLKLLQTEPLGSEFLLQALSNPPAEVKAEVVRLYTSINHSTARLIYQKPGQPTFRSDIDPQKAMEITAMVLDGLAQKYLKQKARLTGDPHSIWREVEEYLYILKVGMVQPEAISRDASS